MHEVSDEDIEMLSLSKADRAVYEKLLKNQADIAALAKRIEFVAEAYAALDKQAAFNKQQREDDALVSEYKEHGLTPAVMKRREASELDVFRKRDDDVD